MFLLGLKVGASGLSCAEVFISSWSQDSSLNCLLDCACCWAHLIQMVVCFSISPVLRGPMTRLLQLVLVWCRNLATQAPPRNTRHNLCFSSSSSRALVSFVSSTANANTSLVSFTSSALVSCIDAVSRCGGQSCGCHSQQGPCHQRVVSLLTCPPLLPFVQLLRLQVICFS